MAKMQKKKTKVGLRVRPAVLVALKSRDENIIAIEGLYSPKYSFCAIVSICRGLKITFFPAKC